LKKDNWLLPKEYMNAQISLETQHCARLLSGSSCGQLPSPARIVFIQEVVGKTRKASELRNGFKKN